MPPKIYKKWMHRELEALSIHEFEREGGDWRVERRVESESVRRCEVR
jgi:hypothetical protein